MSTKQRVKSMIDAGARPVPAKRNRTKLMLSHGRLRTALSKDDGTPTTSGLFWESLSGQSLPDSGMMSKTPFRENNTEYITVNGTKRVTRHLDLATGEWVFSKLGMKLYRK